MNSKVDREMNVMSLLKWIQAVGRKWRRVEAEHKGRVLPLSLVCSAVRGSPLPPRLDEEGVLVVGPNTQLYGGDFVSPTSAHSENAAR